MVLARTLEPTGIGRDGPARLYEKLVVPAGRHLLTLRLADTDRTEGFDHERRFELEMAPRRNVAIDFQPDRGGFVIR